MTTKWTCSVLASCALAIASPSLADTETEREVSKTTETNVDDDAAVEHTEESTRTETDDGEVESTKSREETTTATGDGQRTEQVEEETVVEED